MARPCSYPGCRTLVSGGRCGKHKTPRAPKVVDPFYKTKQWYRIRAAALKRDGHRCVMCEVDVSAKGAAIVDHIVPLKQAPHLGLELSNLRTLCRPCDNKRHAKDRAGFRYQPAPIRVNRSRSKDWNF